ncbi:MAG: DsrE family protein [Desulfohalobiaceae bacterium]|nr:DsrE family protein [Desulfohalobiaceae bacterium]
MKTRLRAFTGKDKNPNTEIIQRLDQMGVKIYVCLQALAHRELRSKETLPTVTVAAAAATVIIHKQMAGYAYFPFH